jgi:RNA-directed DNA polymerase
MSSGSYFPGPVRAVEIPKKGGTRVLGIPNVVDRVAQTVAVLAMEPAVEKVFHPDSYGYRPGRSPLDAIKVCRQRCWDKEGYSGGQDVMRSLFLPAACRHKRMACS